MKDNARQRSLQFIHVAKRDLNLDDDDYRALLKRVTGLSSCADMDPKQLGDVAGEMRCLGAGRKKGLTPQQRKAQHLWRAAYALGAVDSSDGRALDSFCKRTAGVDALQWTTPEQVNKVVEALKAMCARHGFTPPDFDEVKRIEAARAKADLPPGGAGVANNARLIEAIWQKLVDAGVFRTGSFARLDTWMHNNGYHISAPQWLGYKESFEVVAELANWLRKIRAEQAAAGGDG